MTKYSTNIPEARKQLEEIADEIVAAHPDLADHAQRIKLIVTDMMTQRSPVRRAPNHSKPMTQATRDAIRADLVKTDLSQEEIAARHGVDGGRVSEELNSMNSMMKANKT